MEWARQAIGLSATAKNVLNALAWEADDVSQVAPGAGALELWTGLHRTSIFRAVDELCKSGMITVLKAAGVESLITLQVGATSSGERLVAKRNQSHRATSNTSSGAQLVAESNQLCRATSSGEQPVNQPYQSLSATSAKTPSISLTTLTTDDDDDPVKSSSPSVVAPAKKRKAPAADDGGRYMLGAMGTREFSAAQLRAGAELFAAEFNLAADWAGFPHWLEKAEPYQVLYLLQWLAFYSGKPPEEFGRIRNFAGLLRSHLKHYGHPGELRGELVNMLEEYCGGPLPEEITAVNDERYKRQSPAWVEPQEDMAAYLGMWR